MKLCQGKDCESGIIYNHRVESPFLLTIGDRTSSSLASVCVESLVIVEQSSTWSTVEFVMSFKHGPSEASMTSPSVPSHDWHVREQQEGDYVYSMQNAKTFMHQGPFPLTSL